MSSIASKVNPKLLKAINKYGVDVEAYRHSLNEFGESTEDNILIVKFKGLYSESNHSVNQDTVDGGVIKKDKMYKLIALINEDSEKLEEQDILIIKNTKFKLININNANMLDCYLDLTLKRCF